jgi:mannosyltransferase OCH1-like enzyme
MKTNLLLRYASTRSLQLIGNILKIVFYLDITLRPGKRYRIPDRWPPLLATSKAKAIPRIVWQTNYSRDVTLSLYLNYLVNRLMAPTSEFRFCDDDECEEFITKRQPPEVAAAYIGLQIGAARADLWRVIVLSTYGGVYLDADATFSWPPEYFLSSDQSELFAREPDGRLTNYFLAAVAGHPMLMEIAAKIVENIQANEIASVYDMTGPTVVNELAGRASVRIAPSRSVCRQGQLTKKVFQYPDRLRGYWAKEQLERPIVLNP